MIAMSGGVDSAAAALLLLEQGYEAAGATFRLWERPDGGNREVDDAAEVCRGLGIPHHVFDYREIFNSRVVTPFVQSYLSGKTPNPCILCNKYIKFGIFSDFAREMGYDCFATGHYARRLYDQSSGLWQLCKALHTAKDQSYVLYSLTQKQLSALRLPLGEYEKSQIREITAASGLKVAHKADSQDICFIPDGDCGKFIAERCSADSFTGDFVDTDGKILGQHKGIFRYTVGQRKGLGIALGRPVYVKEVIPHENKVVIAFDEADIFRSSVTVENINYIDGAPPASPIRVTAKLRYAHREAEALLTPLPGDGLSARLDFELPQRAPAPGQSAVFYIGERVLGGGIIL